MRVRVLGSCSGLDWVWGPGSGELVLNTVLGEPGFVSRLALGR